MGAVVGAVVTGDAVGTEEVGDAVGTEVVGDAVGTEVMSKAEGEPVVGAVVVRAEVGQPHGPSPRGLFQGLQLAACPMWGKVNL